MKTILLTFILIVNQPNGLTVPEAKQAVKVAVAKLNTLSTKVRFRAMSLKRMRDPFDDSNGYIRIAKWNNYFMRRHSAANYIHVFDVNRDVTLAGVAYLCQPFSKRKQVSITMQQRDGTPTYHGVAAAHEIGHQLGFDHVAFYFDDYVSIMDWDLFAYRLLRHARRFAFADPMEDLEYFDCKANDV